MHAAAGRGGPAAGAGRAAGPDAAAAAGEPGAPGPGTGPAREALERAIIGKTINLLMRSR
jgi:hypothetical protein